MTLTVVMTKCVALIRRGTGLNTYSYDFSTILSAGTEGNELPVTRNLSCEKIKLILTCNGFVNINNIFKHVVVLSSRRIDLFFLGNIQNKMLDEIEPRFQYSWLMDMKCEKRGEQHNKRVNRVRPAGNNFFFDDEHKLVYFR